MTDARPVTLSEVVLRLSGVVKTFRGRGRSNAAVRAVNGVDLEIKQGEAFALVGESGCGKSTLARLMVRLLQPDQGVVEYRGLDISRMPEKQLRPLRRNIQMVFQDPHSSLNPRRTMRSTLAQALMLNRPVAARALGSRIAELLTDVGLSPASAYMDRYPHEMSGGQLQRVTIARALASEPTVLVADEPVASLDVSVQAQILQLLVRLKVQHSLTIVFITHDLGVVRAIADRVGVMYLGELVDIGETEDVIATPKHPYTRALIDAAPSSQHSSGRSRLLITGELPSPRHRPSGCAFHPRCPVGKKIAMCASDHPELRATTEAPGQLVACHFAEQVALESLKSKAR